MTGYEFHPEAESDLEEIWEYIAADSVGAADRVIDSSNPGGDGRDAETARYFQGSGEFPRIRFAFCECAIT